MTWYECFPQMHFPSFCDVYSWREISCLKPVLYFPHEQSGCVHGQRGRGLLVFILPKAYADGSLRKKHVNKQLPRIIAHLAVFILFYRRILQVRIAMGFFTQPAHVQLVLLKPTDHAVTKNWRHVDVRSEPPRTIFMTRIPLGKYNTGYTLGVVLRCFLLVESALRLSRRVGCLSWVWWRMIICWLATVIFFIC